MNVTRIVASAVAAALAVPALVQAEPTGSAPAAQMEKCYGINVRGKNDCSAPGAHGCAGQSRVSNDPKSWVYVPAGTCAKIAGGSTQPKS